MPKVRLGVALLLPEPFATEVNGIRRALGDRSLERIAPHITLVPPVNVNVTELPAALRLLRTAGSSLRPFEVELGPVASFAPVSPVLMLDVGSGSDAVLALRDKVFQPPLERPLTHPFVPHLTIADETSDARIAAALESLDSYRVAALFDRAYLLQEDEGRAWRPVADFPFEEPAVVGRGGIDLELTTSHLLDPEASALFDPERASSGDLVVVARQRGGVVAAALGSEGALTDYAESPGLGVLSGDLEAHVRRRWEYANMIWSREFRR